MLVRLDSVKSDMSEHPTSPTAFSGLFKKESKEGTEKAFLWARQMGKTGFILNYLEALMEDEDDWIEWEEGFAPPPPKALVEVKFRNGEVGEDLAEEWRWSCLGSEYDIVAYRVVTPKPDLEEVSEYLRENDWKDEKAAWSKSRDKYLKWAKYEALDSPYIRAFPYDTIDIYRVLQVYEVTDPCIQHAVKKLLCAGQRGYKEVEKDIDEAIQSMERWKQMREEEDGNSD